MGFFANYMIKRGLRLWFLMIISPLRWDDEKMSPCTVQCADPSFVRFKWGLGFVRLFCCWFSHHTNRCSSVHTFPNVHTNTEQPPLWPVLLWWGVCGTDGQSQLKICTPPPVWRSCPQALVDMSDYYCAREANQRAKLAIEKRNLPLDLFQAAHDFFDGGDRFPLHSSESTSETFVWRKFVIPIFQ